MDFSLRSPDPDLDYGSKQFIIMDTVPVIFFIVAAILFRRHIDNIAYLIALGILLIATFIKIVLNIQRWTKGENNKSLDDAFPMVLGPGLFAFAAGVFWKIFTDHDLIFNVIGKSPRIIFFLLMVACLAGRLLNVFILQRNDEPTLGNRVSKFCDIGAMLFFLVFSILCLFV